MHSNRFVISVARVAGMLAPLALAACSGGGSARPGPDAAAEAGTDASSGVSCQSIRVCVGSVATVADADRCVAMGTPEAQQTYAALRSCLTSAPASCSSDLDLSCVCQEQCYADGYCIAEADACLGPGAATDLYCNGPCAP